MTDQPKVMDTDPLIMEMGRRRILPEADQMIFDEMARRGLFGPTMTGDMPRGQPGPEGPRGGPSLLSNLGAAGKAVGRGALENLDTAGMMFGSGLGAAAGMASPVPGDEWAMTSFGGTVGAGIGGTVEDLIKSWLGVEGAQKPSAARTVGHMKSGLMAEMAGPAAAAAGGKVLKPFGSKLDELTKTLERSATGKAMAEAGYPVSPDVYAPTKTAKALTWVAENFYPGKYFVNKYRDQFQQMMLEARHNLIVRDLGMMKPGMDPYKVGLKKAKALYSKTGQQLAEPEALIPIDNIRALAKQYPDSEVAAKIKRHFGDVEKVDVAHMTNFLSRIYKKGARKGYEQLDDREMRRALKEATLQDLEAFDKTYGTMALEAQKRADAFFGKLGKLGRDVGRSSYLEKGLNRATRVDIDTGQHIYNPVIFDQWFRQNQKQLKRMFPDEYSQIERFNRMGLAAVKDLLAAQRGRTPENMQEVLVIVGQGAALTAKPELAVPIGFQAWMSKSLMDPKGVVRKWLTTGLELPTPIGTAGREAVKIGTLKGLEEDED